MTELITIEHDRGPSMKFKEISGDNVIIDALPSQKAELAAFIKASLSTKELNVARKSGVDQESIEALHEVVTDQSKNEEPLIIDIGDFAQISAMAYAWEEFAFKEANPARQFDVSRDTVASISDVHKACFAIE